MTWIAWKMLTGERSKYLAIIFGVTFACFLIAEQSARLVSGAALAGIGLVAADVATYSELRSYLLGQVDGELVTANNQPLAAARQRGVSPLGVFGSFEPPREAPE